MRLTTYMEAHHISGRRIALSAGVHPSVVSKLLSGTSMPSRETIVKLVEAFPDLTPLGVMSDYLDASL